MYIEIDTDLLSDYCHYQQLKNFDLNNEKVMEGLLMGWSESDRNELLGMFLKAIKESLD